MRYREHEEYFQLGLDDVGTKIIDLHTASPLSALRLTFRGTNGATSCKDNRINDVITKIEIIDGSDQLLSLSLKEAQALEFRRTGKMPYMRPGELGGGNQEESCLLLFGREMWDPDLYLDLSKFKNPQLKITTNIAAVAVASATAFLSGSLKVTVDMYLIEEGAAPAAGFMMAKNIYGFTSAASGDEHIDMPTDYPYVNLLVRAYAVGKDVDENISKLKINCDSGQFTPIDKRVFDLYMKEDQDIGPAEMRYYLYRKNGETITYDLNHDPIISLLPSVAGEMVGAAWSWSGRSLIYLYSNEGAAITTEELIQLIVKGSCPHATANVAFGKRIDPATYFDATKFGDIDLVLTQAYASAVSVVLEQLRPYKA